jgi:hypothetical protein
MTNDEPEIHHQSEAILNLASVLGLLTSGQAIPQN